MADSGESNRNASYLAVAEAYSAGARALFSAGLPPDTLERAPQERTAAVDFGAGDIAVQGDRLAPISERFTQTAASLLADPDPQVRADASAQMLAKALVDLQISAYFLQAADAAENPTGQSFGLEQSFRSERSAAVANVEDALAVILAEPGKGAFPVERGAGQAFGVAVPTHVPAARKQVSQMTVDMLEQIEARAGKTAQSAMGGLFAIGIGQVTQAAGLIGMNVAQAVGIGEKVGQLYALVRTFFVNAYDTILTLIGPALVKTATTQVVSWVHGAVQGKQFIAAVNTIYGTANTKAELRALVENSQAQLDNYIGALGGLDQLNQQYIKQMGLVEKVIQVLRFVPSIPLAAVPQARLLLGATYIVLTGYVIFAGADYVDAPRFNKLDRIPGPRKIINKHLYPEQGDGPDGGGGTDKDTPPDKPPSGGGQTAEPPDEDRRPQAPPKPQAPKPPVTTEEPPTAGSEPEEPVESMPPEEESEMASGAEPPEEVGESQPAPPPPPSYGGIDFSLPGGSPAPVPAPAPAPPTYARESEPPETAAPAEDLIEEAIRLDVAAPKTPVVVGEAFEIAVAIRQPQSGRLAVDGLESITSAEGVVYRRAERDLVRYKVIVTAPACKVESPEQSFLLHAGRDSEARFFLLTPLSAGTQTIVVTAYQEDDLVVAQTRLRVEVSVRAVAPVAAPSRDEMRDQLLKELTERGIVLPAAPAARAGSFTFENLDVELFDYSADDDENERFKVRVECVLAGEQSIADADEVVVPPGLRRSLNLLKRRGLQPEELVELGKQLGQMLFPPTARWYYEQSRARLREDEALRIRIKTDDYPLANIAWEFAYLTPRDATPTYTGPDGFLTLDRRISLVRYEVLGQPVASLEPVDGAQLVMLLMLANSGDPEIPKLNLSQEKKNIVKALEKTNQIELKSFANVDYRTLQDALDTRAHIFHFAGHGMFQGDLGSLRSTVGEGYLLLKGKTPREALFPASKLALNLRDSGVRLAVLGVCEGGERDPVNAWTGVAPALARAGIPAVVAMQFKVYDHAAIAFHRSFYRALAAGEPVDTAVTNGRRAVFNLPDGDRDWGTPVLYLRAEDGVLFPRPPAPAFGGLSFGLPAAPAAPAPPKDPRQIRLYEALSGYAFSIDDLEETCFRLGLDWDALEHDTKPIAAREMVLYFTRRGELDRLYHFVKVERPALNLP